MKKNWCLFAVLAIVLAWLLQAVCYFPVAGAMPVPFAPVVDLPAPVLPTVSLWPF